MTFNQSLVLLIVAIALGYLVLSFAELALAIAFWCAVGVGVSCAVDVAAGLGERACALRVRVSQWWARGAQFGGNVVNLRR